MGNYANTGADWKDYVSTGSHSNAHNDLQAQLAVSEAVLDSYTQKQNDLAVAEDANTEAITKNNVVSDLQNNIQIRNAHTANELAAALEDEESALTGVGGAAIGAADAMSQLAAATGDYFMQARKSDEFNPFEAALEAAAGKGANAFQLAQFGTTAGLFSQSEANEFMNEAFMRQQMDGIISDMIKAGDTVGAAALVKSLEAGLTEGDILAQDFFKDLNDETVTPMMDLDTETLAWKAFTDWQGRIEESTTTATIDVDWKTGGGPSTPGTGGEIPGAQHGGPVSANSPYIVGEAGPEVFVPGSSGNIVPNNALGGNTIVVNNYTKEAAAVAMTMAWAQQRRRF